MTSTRAMHRAALVMIAVFIGTGCHRAQPNPAAAFPLSNDVAGWNKISEVRTFEAADLWKYIDGEAEKYLSAGVQRTSTADYKYQDKLETVVDLYSMSNVAGVKQIFDSEPAADAKSVQVGNAAHLFSQSLVFCKGRYLVRIVTYEDSPDAQQALLALGHGIDRRLPK